MARTRVADFEIFEDKDEAREWLRNNPAWDLLGVFPYPDNRLYFVVVRREIVRD